MTELVYCVTRAGNSPVEREIAEAGLSKTDATRLSEAVTRLLENRLLPGDVKKLNRTVWELRVDGVVDHVTYRLLYAREGKPVVILALVFYDKRSKKTPLDVISRAENRLVQHRASGVR